MPDWSKSIRERLDGLGLDLAREAAIVEELTQHANDRYEELLSRGLAETEASRLVLDELDGDRLQKELRRSLPRPPAAPPPESETSSGSASGLWRDLRHAVRRLRLEPGFAAVAVLSLALGIGANTAIFQLLDALRLRSLPVPRPNELASVQIVDNPHGRTGGFSGRYPQLTYAMWERLAASQQAFSRFAAWSSEPLNLAPGGEARNAEALWVSGNFFETLEVPALMGRVITPADDRPGCAMPGVVVSETFWEREFGGSQSVLGSKLT